MSYEWSNSVWFTKWCEACITQDSVFLLDLTSLMKSEQIASILEGWRVLVPLIPAMLTDRCFWFDVNCLSRNYNNIFQKALV